jgi:hypothetical protein
MGKSLLTGCVSVPVPDDARIPLLRLSRSEPCLGEAEVFPGAMVEPSLTCTTVGEVVVYGIRGGGGGPVAEAALGRGEDLRRGPVCFSYHIRCPIGG